MKKKRKKKRAGKRFTRQIWLLGVLLLLLAGLGASPLGQAFRSADPTSLSVGVPNSLSVSQLRRQYAAVGSPLQGSELVTFRLGVKYGIDDAFYVAWTYRETKLGTTVPSRYWNFNGIECSNLCDSCHSGNGHSWCNFGSAAAGIEAWFALIRRYLDGGMARYLGWGNISLDTVQLISCGPFGNGAYNGDSGSCGAYAQDIGDIVLGLRAGKVYT